MVFLLTLACAVVRAHRFRYRRRCFQTNLRNSAHISHREQQDSIARLTRPIFF